MVARLTLAAIDRKKCVAQIPGLKGIYGYDPSLAAGIVLCVLFGSSMLLHTFTAVRYRVWWQIVLAVGALSELIGWAGRTWGSYCPYETTPFLIQICTLILAPAFFTAGIYVILGRLIETFGRHISPISANAYLWIFCTVDLVSLIVQASGGGMASIAFQKTPPGNSAVGTHIMVAGILFQLASLLIFSSLFTLVILRALREKGEILKQRKVRYIIAGTVLSVFVIVTRSIYRTIELLQGWNGYLMNTERFFIGLDGSLMVIAVAVFNFAQPMWAERANVISEQTTDGIELETGNTTLDK